MKLVWLLLLILGCDDRKPQHKPTPMKFCIEACMESTFRMFHNSSGQFLGGGGSSSMNGLSQTQIFDRVKAECKEFYQDETCCKADRSVYPYGIQHNHGLDYGACLEPEERRAKQQET